MTASSPQTRGGRARGLRARSSAVAVGMTVAGVLLAGCGSVASGHDGRTVRAETVQVPAAVKASEQKAHAEVMASLHAPVGRSGPAELPRYVERPKLGFNRLVTATTSHPQLAIAGDSVILDLPSGRAQATLNGPLYNNSYVGTNDPVVPARFILDLTSQSGTIPLAKKDFTVLDQLGNDIVPKLVVQGGGVLPRELAPGQHLRLTFSTTISAGDGSIVYNPTGIVKAGHRPLAGWDFIVEDD